METWTLRAVVVLLSVIAPLAGVAAAWWAQGDAGATARDQRAERRPVRAEVVGRTSAAVPAAQTGRTPSARATVRWTEPGQGPRTAEVRVPAGTRTGERVGLWLDARGRAVPPPPDAAAVWQHAVTVGVLAAGASVALIVLGHGLVRQTAMRRRLAEWETAWTGTEPAWTGRRG
ncbi:integral membrane protein [Streptomyces zinciresistens K42]|uniref:Integral membrane protein n=1 Tax=Streptomyces zinciresistens K42 TaxID=700597 RepID=G2GKQ6_9ACTN|nr:integral membrane protein [Streptomyces zinciresistens K42]